MIEPPIRVLYVGGWGRSGSTLLAIMLGQVEGFVAVGEVREIWRRGLLENGPCGCGLPFRECDFWSAVGSEAFGGWHQVDLPSVLRARYALDRGWTIPLLAARSDRILGRDLLSGYVGWLERLYRAIGEVSGARWIVDSSKLPSHALVLRRIAGSDVRLLHLLRDSRGVAYSWHKQLEARRGSSGRRLERYGPFRASVRYGYYNSATSALRRTRIPYRRLRYEDVAHDPARGIRHALELAGEPTEGALGFLSGVAAKVQATHTADGNPMRFLDGTLSIRLDDLWRDRMPASHRAIVTTLTWPWLAAYGYATRP